MEDNFHLSCPFCSLDESGVALANALAFAIYDGYPISPGHALIIPRRHVASLFEATRTEREALFDLLELMRHKLVQEYNPDGFNIGINDGATAGQTVMHLHIHLIPRYVGDKAEPRGGVRWIFPEKADYWSNRK